MRVRATRIRKPEVTAADIVVDALRAVTPAAPVTFRNLTLLPLVAGNEQDIDYAVLDEALARGWIEITESGEHGHVPELTVVNRGDVPVLILDGEELLGAMQNRILNLTVLVPPRHASTLPVSCVESGRWQRVSRHFVSAPRTQFAAGRAAKMAQVSHSLAESGSRMSDQSAVWSLIAEKSARLGAASDTSAMSAMFERFDDSLDAFLTAFPVLDRQVGAVFFVNRCLAGLELFDAASTWRKLSSKLLRSYALDVIDQHQETSAPVSPMTGAALIDAIVACKASVFPAVGEGEDVRLVGASLTGAALVARGRAVHVSAFPAAAGR
jgi:hypothetical protein